jgi:hypothetical protein
MTIDYFLFFFWWVADESRTPPPQGGGSPPDNSALALTEWRGTTVVNSCRQAYGVTCVVTLPSLPLSEGIAPCRSGTGEGQRTTGKPA